MVRRQCGSAVMHAHRIAAQRACPCCTPFAHKPVSVMHCRSRCNSSRAAARDMTQRVFSGHSRRNGAPAVRQLLCLNQPRGPSHLQKAPMTGKECLDEIPSCAHRGRHLQKPVHFSISSQHGLNLRPAVVSCAATSHIATLRGTHSDGRAKTTSCQVGALCAKLTTASGHTYAAQRRDCSDCAGCRLLPTIMPAACCAGITLSPWLQILTFNRAYIDWRLYWHRVLFLTGMATLNSSVAAWEALRHGRAIAQQRLHPEPVFILGHPRTGTTQ